MIYSVIAVASVRIPTLSSFVTFNDPTWNNVPTFLWSCVETTVVHICAAAPALRKLFSRVKDHVSTAHYSRKYVSSSSRYDSSTGDRSNSSKGGRRRGSGLGILTTSSVTRNSTTLEKAMHEVELENMERAASPTRMTVDPPTYIPPFHKHGQTTTTITANPTNEDNENAIVEAIRRSNSRSNRLSILNAYSNNFSHGNAPSDDLNKIRFPHSKFSFHKGALSSSPLKHNDPSRQLYSHQPSSSNARLFQQAQGTISNPHPTESVPHRATAAVASSSQDSILAKPPSQHSNDTRTTSDTTADGTTEHGGGDEGHSFLNTLNVPTAMMDRSFLSLSSTDEGHRDDRSR